MFCFHRVWVLVHCWPYICNLFTQCQVSDATSVPFHDTIQSMSMQIYPYVRSYMFMFFFLKLLFFDCHMYLVYASVTSRITWSFSCCGHYKTKNKAICIPGNNASDVMCAVLIKHGYFWCGQIIEYIMVKWSCSFVCSFNYITSSSRLCICI